MSEFTDMLVRQISLFGITDLIDICVVAYVMFQLIKLLRETRAIQLVKGLLALVAVYLAAHILQLRSILCHCIDRSAHCDSSCNNNGRQQQQSRPKRIDPELGSQLERRGMCLPLFLLDLFSAVIHFAVYLLHY